MSTIFSHVATRAVGLALLLFQSRDAISPPDPWLQASRLIGAPLQGAWSMSPDGACYRESPVWRFDPARVIFYQFPLAEIRHDVRVKVTHGGRIKVEYYERPGDSTSLQGAVFRDRGDRLEWELLIENGVSTLIGEHERPADLVNCGTHTTSQRLWLIVKAPFNTKGWTGAE